MPLPDPIREVLTTFRPVFRAPTWRKRMMVFTGTLRAQGRRTVTAALREAGHWSLFPQVLNRACWSPLAVSRQLCASRSPGGTGHSGFRWIVMAVVVTLPWTRSAGRCRSGVCWPPPWK
ncbi:MAG TPA: hypothetical protein VGF67_07145 [Ktedonobacteraceae bacterium]